MDARLVKEGYAERLRRLQSIRVEYMAERTFSPPFVDRVPATMPLDPARPSGAVVRVKPLVGKLEAKCAFMMADTSRFLYETELTEATVSRLQQEQLSWYRYEQECFIGDVAVLTLVSLNGQVSHRAAQAHPLPAFSGMDVALGLRLPGENQWLERRDLETAAVTVDGGEAILELVRRPGQRHYLTIAPHRDYALVKYRMEIEGNLRTEIVCTEFREAVPGFPVPYRAALRVHYSALGVSGTSHAAEFHVRRYQLGSVNPSAFRYRLFDTYRVWPFGSAVGARAEAYGADGEPSPASLSGPAGDPSPRRVADDGERTVSQAALLESATVLYEHSYDFGRVQAGSVVSHSFIVINRGQKPLQIRRMVADCACTTLPKAQPAPLAPNEAMRIPIRLNLSAATGATVKHVMLEFEDQALRPVLLTIRGVVE